jgi:hypothetical protein
MPTMFRLTLAGHVDLSTYRTVRKAHLAPNLPVKLPSRRIPRPALKRLVWSHLARRHGGCRSRSASARVFAATAAPHGRLHA